jgi:hypothetical protein
MTIWPILVINLDGFMEKRGYKELFNQYYKVRAVPLQYKLNFIQGMTSRAIKLIKPLDVEAIVMTK